MSEQNGTAHEDRELVLAFIGGNRPVLGMRAKLSIATLNEPDVLHHPCDLRSGAVPEMAEVDIPGRGKGQMPTGRQLIQHDACPLQWLASLLEIDLPAGTDVRPVSTMSHAERGELERAYSNGEKKREEMRTSQLGIQKATQMPPRGGLTMPGGR